MINFSILNLSLIKKISCVFLYFKVPKTRGKSNKNGNPEPPMITSSSSGNGLMHSDSLRLTDDDRVSAFVIYASLLSRSRRLKEANKILAEAKVRL